MPDSMFIKKNKAVGAGDILEEPTRVIVNNRVKSRKIILTILILFMFIKLPIILKGGAFGLSDESRYLQSVSAIENLIRGDINRFCFALSSTHCRPGDAIRNLIPASFQMILYKVYGIDPRNPESLFIPMLFNIIISILLSYFFFKTSLLLFNNNLFLSSISTIIYSLLVNNNIYIRHLLPYDMSLLCFLSALYLVISNFKEKGELNNNSLLKISILSSAGYFIYPGYYFLSILIIVTVIFLNFQRKINDLSKNLKKIIFQTIIYISPFFVITLLFEVIAYFGKTYSYLTTCAMVSTSITQGSPEESFSFILKYLVEIEKGIGIILLMCSFSYTICLIFYVFSKNILKRRLLIFIKNKEVLFLFCSVFVGYILYALAGVFGIFVFYGRILHLYFPFLVWGSIYFIDTLLISATYKKIILCILVVFSLYNFISFYIDYQTIAYPRDVFYKFGFVSKSKPNDYVTVECDDIRKSSLLTITDLEKTSSQYIAETPQFFYYLPPPNNPWKKYNIIDMNNYKFINFCYFYPVGKASPSNNVVLKYYRKYRGKNIEESQLSNSPQPFNKFIPENGWKVIFSQPHYLNFEAYMFEGLTIESRKLVKERSYKVIILEKSADVNSGIIPVLRQ